MMKPRLWMFGVALLLPAVVWAQAERPDGGGTSAVLRELVMEVRALRADLVRTRQIELRATIVAERHHVQADVVQRLGDQLEQAGRELATAQEAMSGASAEMQRQMAANATAASAPERAAASQRAGAAQEAWNVWSDRVSAAQTKQARLTEQLSAERSKLQALDDELKAIEGGLR